MSTYAPTEVIAKVIDDTVPDLTLRNAKTLDFLSAKGRVQTAEVTDMYWDVVTGESGTATVPMTTAGVAQPTGATTQAGLNIGTYKIYHQFDLNRVSLKNIARRAPDALKEQMKFHVKKGLTAIRRQVNNYIWNATGTAAFGGFVGFPVVLDNTLPYAGIDPAVHTNWVAIKNTAGANRNLTRTILYDFHRLLEEEETGYDCIWTSPLTSQTYNTLFDSIAGNLSVQRVTTTDKVDLAPGTRYYDGVPIQTDKQIPVGQIVAFDSSEVSLLSFDLSDADQGMLDRFGLNDNFSTIASADVGGMKVNVALLPQNNPGILTFQMFVIPQLKVFNRRAVMAIDKLN